MQQCNVLLKKKKSSHLIPQKTASQHWWAKGRIRGTCTGSPQEPSPCLGSPGCRPLPARRGGTAQVNALHPTTAWLAQSGCTSLSPHSSLGQRFPQAQDLLITCFIEFFKKMFVKKPPHIFAPFFFFLKSPPYDYSARGLGTSEHYQHAVGGQSSPTNTSL